MRVLLTVVKQLFGLFVDDGSLAIAILALIGALAALQHSRALSPEVGGLVLFFGLAILLVENVWRSVRRFDATR
jgi:hypothetical protein